MFPEHTRTQERRQGPGWGLIIEGRQHNQDLPGSFPPQYLAALGRVWADTSASFPLTYDLLLLSFTGQGKSKSGKAGSVEDIHMGSALAYASVTEAWRGVEGQSGNVPF